MSSTNTESKQSRKRYCFNEFATTSPYHMKVATYNILAQCFVNREYFPYAAKPVLRQRNRLAHLLKEIGDLDADILCLQELDLVDFWETSLHGIGYDGLHVKRTGTKKDGCGLFWKQHKYTLVQQEIIYFNDLAEIEKDDNLIKDNVALIVCLKDNLIENTYVCVACCHIYWDPSFIDIKLKQAKYLLERTAKFVTVMKQQLEIDTVPWIIAGDFNSQPNDEVYKLIMDRTGCKHPLPTIASAYANYIRDDGTVGEPHFTNYTEGFKGCLDYIFYDSGLLKVHELRRLPNEEQLAKETALPSSLFASDHLPLCCTFCIEEQISIRNYTRSSLFETILG